MWERNENKIKFAIFCAFVFLFFFPPAVNQKVEAGCVCYGTARIVCRVDQPVASGDRVYCDARGDIYNQGCLGCYDGEPCWGATDSSGCSIGPGSTSCSMSSLDCQCHPWEVSVDTRKGSLSFDRFSGSCNNYGFTAYNRGTTAYVALANPNTCNVWYDYTGASSSCTPSNPAWGWAVVNSVTKTTADISWSLATWGDECSCRDDREFENHLYSGSGCTNWIKKESQYDGRNLGLGGSRTITGLEPNTEYSFKVYALNRCYASGQTSYITKCLNFTTEGDVCSEENPKGSFHACTYNGQSFNNYVGEFTSSGSGYQYDWNYGGPNNRTDDFSVRWRGQINFSPGTYRFRVRTDDGSRLYVDGDLKIESWKAQGPTDYYSDWINLNSWVSLVHEYYESGGGATAWLTWEKLPEFSCPTPNFWCTNHGGIFSTVPYDIFNWTECVNWCDSAMSETNPICQYNADGPRNCWVNSPPSGNIAFCNWSTSNPPFGAVWDGFGCERDLPAWPISVVSSDSSSCVGDTVSFTTLYRDDSGWDNIVYAYITINNTASGQTESSPKGAIKAYLNLATGGWQIRNNDDTGWLPFGTNSNGYAIMGTPSYSGSGDDLTVVWTVTFLENWEPEEANIYLQVIDKTFWSPSGYLDLGDFSIQYCNNPPVAAFHCQPSSCNVFSGESLQLINDSTDPEGQSDIVQTDWTISESTNSYSGYNEAYTVQTGLLERKLHDVELYVKDSQGESDTALGSIRIKQDIVAGFMCSVNNNDWQACENISPSIGDMIYLKDDIFLTEHSAPSEGAVINSRTWRANGITFSQGNDKNPGLEISDSSTEVILVVGDTAFRTGSRIHTISAILPLPSWIEVRPF